MGFITDIVGIFTFRKSAIKEIGESEELTLKGWILLIGSSFVAGLYISSYYFSEAEINLENLIVGLFIPFLFCFFFGFDLAWIVATINKDYSKMSILTLDKL